MSHYLEYIKEREGKEVYETPYGFVIYELKPDYCYIQDIYVVPAMRKAKVASHLADEVTALAKAKGCKHLLGSVDPRANNAHTSLLVLLGYGMRLYKTEKDIIYFVKGIS